MHAKYLGLLALSSVALGQDWLSDAMDALESNTDFAVPTDIPNLEDYLDDSGYLDDLNSLTDSLSAATPTTTGSSSSSDDDSSDSSGGFDFDIPSSILTELMTAIPPSALAELGNEASLSSLVSEAQEGNYPDWVSDLSPEVTEYIESAWGVEAAPTGSSGGDDDDSSSSNNNSSNDNNDDSDNNSDDDQDAAGMVSPSVFGSIVAAAGVLGLAVAL
ncbi:hypothetical protein BJY04DRAFT_88025 [Aspergillus karnatakaensis]|uniref:uncharacterized protein n=1 Tax=Aspergillus karnatakaensis TaxID=1810916 RepID=UPI003CCDBF77